MHRRVWATKHTHQSSCREDDGISYVSQDSPSKKPSRFKEKNKYKNPLAKQSDKLLGLIASICAIYLVIPHDRLADWRQYPRCIIWEYRLNTVATFTLSVLNQYRQVLLIEEATNEIENSKKQLVDQNPMVEEEHIEPCQPMHQWMKETYPACNNLHEVQLFEGPDSISFINCGGSRCAFRIVNIDGDPLVLKTQKYRSSFTEKSYSAARTDALAMERLSASPYVSKLFSGCATSQLVEYSNGGNIHDLIKLARLEGDDTQSPLDKLKINYQVAMAVAHMHTFEDDGIPSLTHNDLCCHQFILVDGIYKLTDFHLSSFHRRNKQTQEVCNETAIDVNEVLMKLRAPEEQFIGDDEDRKVMMEKIDVYMMGNVMYYVLTKKWLFEELTTDEATAQMVKGRRSIFPKDILESHDIAIQAIVMAINACWIHEVEKRPTARNVSNILKKALETLLGTTDLGIVRVSVPPLPKHYRYTDSDFYVNLGGEL